MANLLATKTGGVYISLGCLKLMQSVITDKNSKGFQRLGGTEETNGLNNKANISSATIAVGELLLKRLPDHPVVAEL